MLMLHDAAAVAVSVAVVDDFVAVEYAVAVGVIVFLFGCCPSESCTTATTTATTTETSTTL